MAIYPKFAVNSQLFFMKIDNCSLKPYNTFGIDVNARTFSAFTTKKDLLSLLEMFPKETSLLILGGGSNILFTKDVDGPVLKNEIKGIEIVQEDDDSFLIKTGAGENWHSFVLETIKNNWFGLENLSLIPGTVGAAPIQNIGAYGVEVKEYFEKLDAINRSTGEEISFTHQECRFGYRNSIFKTSHKGQYIITHVYFRLLKKPRFNISYGAIQTILDRNKIKELSAQAISDAIIEIRTSKLPDPKKIGNSGSFFKNPEIDTNLYKQLKSTHPEMPGYVISDTITKIPAGWLIEQAGWKGKRIGDIGVHEHQALVLVNYGNGKGEAIKNLAFEIKASVKDQFGIDIEPEVNIL